MELTVTRCAMSRVPRVKLLAGRTLQLTASNALNFRTETMTVRVHAYQDTRPAKQLQTVEIPHVQTLRAFVTLHAQYVRRRRMLNASRVKLMQLIQSQLPILESAAVTTAGRVLAAGCIEAHVMTHA